MAETLDSIISLALGNVPDISPTESPELYEALLRLHQAIEILVDYYDEVGGIYVTIGDVQTVTGAKTFNALVTLADAAIFNALATFNAAANFNAPVTLADAVNIALNATTGTKIGTAVGQKLGFWNVTPVIQPAAALQSALTNSTGGSQDGILANVTGTATVATAADGVKTNNNFTDIYALLTEIRTALVATGIMKGSA